ncbi:MAG: UDP-3-O-acyl-N-acetylglucosamine deacetylase [Bdellovibrionales bacterium]|nr:UDP-3-O-acyl-N-acetylglucosamine deacetylase [Bdellovibrionales bacterium]
MKNQKTIKQEVSISGIGLHSGKRVTLTLKPARSNYGIRFARTDLDTPVEIPASVGNVHSTTLATTISLGGVRVSTVEHLMSALWAMGIDNVVCAVDGEEVPILDGSALPFAQLIRKAGVKSLRSPKKYLVAQKTIEIREGSKWAVLRPSREFRIRYSIDFPHPVIGKQDFEFSSSTDFLKEIAPCRTFGFLKDVERMQAMGLALGGSLHNAVVLDDTSALNPEGLRFENEFVRHKILDAIGDFSLIGYPILADVELHRAGHDLQTRLVHELIKTPDAYSIWVPRSDEAFESQFCLTTAAYAL